VGCNSAGRRLRPATRTTTTGCTESTVRRVTLLLVSGGFGRGACTCRTRRPTGESRISWKPCMAYPTIPKETPQKHPAISITAIAAKLSQNLSRTFGKPTPPLCAPHEKEHATNKKEAHRLSGHQALRGFFDVGGGRPFLVHGVAAAPAAAAKTFLLRGAGVQQQWTTRPPEAQRPCATIGLPLSSASPTEVANRCVAHGCARLWAN